MSAVPKLTAAHHGPRLSLVATCQGCVYEQSEYYTAQSDSGHRVYCTNEAAPFRVNERAFIGDTSWDTPDWCPLLADARAKFAEALTAAGRAAIAGRQP